jgi:hypothetical protein
MFALGRLRVVRTIVRGKRHSWEPISERLSRLTAPPIDKILSDLDTFGYAIGLRMRKETVERIRRFADAYRSGKAIPDHIGEKRTIIILDEFLDLARECPTLADLATDPMLLTITRQYLNSDPVHIGTKLWWSLAKDSTLAERLKFAQELFHYDVHAMFQSNSASTLRTFPRRPARMFT